MTAPATIEDRLAAIEGTAAKLAAFVPILEKLSEVAPDARKGAMPDPADGDPGAKRVNQNGKFPRGDESKFLLVRAIKAMTAVPMFGYDRAWSYYAPYEKTVIEAGFKAGAEDTGAALAGTPSSSYGFLVPPQFITDLIEVVRAKTVVRAAGARTLTASSNVGFIPRQSAAATAAWIAEAGSITASDLTFQQVQYTIRKLAAYVVLSNELINDADPAVEAIVRADIAAAVALQEDLTGLQGSGTAPTPRGIKNVSGIGSSPSMGTNGGTPTFDNMISAERTVVTANRQPTAWAVNPRTVTTLATIKDTTGRYIWEPAPYLPNVVPNNAQTSYDYLQNAGAIPARPSGAIRGIPVYESTQIPVNNTVGTSSDCSDIYVGQWNELVIVERGGLEFAVSDQILFQNYQTAVRAIVRRDFVTRHAAAFDVVTGVRP